jgi:hypothetical protein
MSKYSKEELEKFFPVTMGEVRKVEATNKERRLSVPKEKVEKNLSKEESMLKEVRKKMGEIALRRAAEKRQYEGEEKISQEKSEENIKIERKEEIMDEIRKAVDEESREEEIVREAIEGEEIIQKPSMENSKSRIISELKGIYEEE